MQFEEILELLCALEKKGELRIMLTADVDIGLVVSSPVGALVVDASGVPNKANVGDTYSGALKVTGGQAPYSFAIKSGALADGLVLGATDGTITGTLTTAGTFDAIITVTDSSPARASVNLRVSNRI